MKVEKEAPALTIPWSPGRVIFPQAPSQAANPTPIPKPLSFGKWVGVLLPTPRASSFSLQGKGKVRTYWLLGERGSSTRG